MSPSVKSGNNLSDMENKKPALRAYEDKRHLLVDGINSRAVGQKFIPARVSDIEDDAQDGGVMSGADAVRDYVRTLTVTDPTRDETLQNPRQPSLSTIT